MAQKSKLRPSVGDRLRILFSLREPEPKSCSHLDQIHEVTPNATGCFDCLQTGDTWVNLRLCMTCGSVGCCDNSKNRHATKHHHATGHPIIKSFQPGEDWLWCYPDELKFELLRL